MNVATLISITTAVVGLLFAAMTWAIASAPGSRGLRAFACSALAGAGYALCMAALSSGSVLASRVGIRLAILFTGLHAAAWLVYSARRDARSLYGYEKAIVLGTLGFGIVGLVPGALYHDAYVWQHPVSWLGILYLDARSTWIGNVSFVFFLGAIVLLAVRAFRRLRASRGEHGTRGELIGLVALAVCGANDSLVTSDVLAMPYLLDLGYLVLVVAVSYDLSQAFVRNAKDLAFAQEELVRQARLAALGEMSAVVAHEVRNPVAVIFNAVATLRKRPADPEKLLGIVEEEAERLKRMVTDLLEFARPESLVIDETELLPILESAIEAVKSANPDESFAIETTVVPGMPKVSCDERLLRQAVINLVTNAVHAPQRASRNGSSRDRVRVVAAVSGSRLSLRVIDEGEGVSKELASRIFVPFFTTRPTGTGLGLPVVRRIAEAHGGEVVLHDTPGGGATFELSIPLGGPGHA